ncbi:MAG: DUF1015 domain-containing protein [SAR324 cluster bacterium]|nr:DUF1015 domain-containing protein [SAR324 cluster bacterium]
MTMILPFKGLRPVAGLAQDVSAPPYDVMNRAEAKEMAKGKPLSFLHISRPEIDLEDDLNPYDEKVYAKGKERLEEMIENKHLAQDPCDSYYFYQMQDGEHIQTGLMAVASAKKYDENLILKHELTRNDKETDRIKMIEGMNAQASPVLLTCKPTEEFRVIGAVVTESAPTAEVVDLQGVTHRLWAVDNPSVVEAVSALFNGGHKDLDKLYIADGHHRSAAGSRVAAIRKEQNPNHTGDESYNYFLSVIFPSDEMKILDYNRVVKDLNGLSIGEFLAKVSESFAVTQVDAAYKPAVPGEVGMFLGKHWYSLKVKEELIPDEATGKLDVSLLYNLLLAPVLAIGNPRTDKRIDFVGGIRGLKELEKRVLQGDSEVAFAMYPTQMEQIISVADAGEIMPPKSTWFEPKLVDGLVSHLL